MRSGTGALTILIQPPWRDHHFQGRPVLPAVEAMQILAEQALSVLPAAAVRAIGDARFPKFLEIDASCNTVEARCQTEALDDGGLQAALASTAIAGSARIRRSVTHAQLRFGGAVAPLPPLPLDLAAAVEGVCMVIDPETIYRELVPFGPGFRSICRPLIVSPDGALAQVRAPAGASPQPGPLGSGFPLDGAFHAACVWGQRYARRVAFPVAIQRRTILAPTRSDASYTARVVPVVVDASQLTVDIWIMDQHGSLCEVALGVTMRDVSRGAWQPPGWMVEDGSEPALARWDAYCQATVILEHAHVAAVAREALTPLEERRLAGMGARRQQGYIGGRLALKRLWRRLTGNDRERPSTAIETVVGNESRPCLPDIGTTPAGYCSLAHDDRFCVAAAHDAPVGIDVEPLTGRALRSGHLFMGASEQAIVDASAMDAAGATLRVWSIKEAAAKAEGLPLAEAWERITVIGIGDGESRFRNDRGQVVAARHATVDGHLVTLVVESGSNRF